MMKMLRLLQMAYAEISKEYKEGEKNTVLGELIYIRVPHT